MRAHQQRLEAEREARRELGWRIRRELEREHVETSEWTLLRKDGVRVSVEVSAIFAH